MKISQTQAIIGIETSCDDTAIACMDLKGSILFNQKETQKIHTNYGGVVPEIAAREHLDNIQFVFSNLMSYIKSNNIKIVGVGSTCLNGMPGGLIVGSSMGLGVARGFGCFFTPVNHLEGHLMSVKIENPDLQFPFVSVLISGGHSMIVLCKEFGQYKILGQSIDDSVGELFDKSARMLGLPYPGGPEIERLAQQYQSQEKQINSEQVIDFPIAIPHSPNFSFSGIKTAISSVIRKIKDANNDQIGDMLPEIAFAIQKCASDNILSKINYAFEKTIRDLHINAICICGGVASNNYIRSQLENFANKKSLKLIAPHQRYCTDNAVMIAQVVLEKIRHNKISSFSGIKSRESIESDCDR